LTEKKNIRERGGKRGGVGGEWGGEERVGKNERRGINTSTMSRIP
jgi:hypothetical protein